MRKKITILDSTLRDGAQAEGISFSVEDKIKIVHALDELGIDFIEAGNPTSNPKDLEFFEKIKGIKLKHAKLVAFGSTRRPKIDVQDDLFLQALVKSGTEAVSIFGKSWDLHLHKVIKISLAENLKMIEDTIKYLKSLNKIVIYDAEHYYDGYFANKEYALKTVETAKNAGADYIALCDTNGGRLPLEIYEITKETIALVGDIVGIHAHNDSELAVASSLMAIYAGATNIQGTLIGFGERCGNANLSAIIPNLQLKGDYYCIADQKIKLITEISRFIAEISNLNLTGKESYIGKSAFAHKGGMHIDGVLKASESFEHIDPELVGNHRRLLMSEVAGRSFVLKHINKINPNLKKSSPEVIRIIERIKELEHEGYQFEGAESSIKLLILKCLGLYKPYFEIENFKTSGIKVNNETKMFSSALVKVRVDGISEITADEGAGPVGALDSALRKALKVFYPEIENMHLVDYKVRVIDSKDAAAAKVRVLIESTDGSNVWTTVGVSRDIIEASLIALVDSIEYLLILKRQKVEV